MRDLFGFGWIRIGWQGLDFLLNEALPERFDQTAPCLDLLEE